MARRSATNCCMCITENKALACQKTCPVTSIGGKDSVKGNRQGSLSRSITRRSDQNRKIKYRFLFCDFVSACQKSPFGLFRQAESPARKRRALVCSGQSSMRPSVEMVTTCQGMSLPQLCSAVFTACSSPPQQGTSMRTTVRSFMSLLRRMAVSFSA